MSLNLPDPNKTVGDPGHTSDTNLIIEAVNTVKSQVDNIPQGPQGPPGEPGTPGQNGLAATITVANTVTSAPGSNAAVTSSGTPQNVALTFTIPRGQTGPTGSTGAQGSIGPQGEPGAPGLGLESGGLTGQVLSKASNADYDTEWVFPGSAPVTSVDGRQGAVTLDDLYDAAGTATSAVSSHNADTTSVHGITNTADLVVTTDARLSDTRTPTDGTVTDAKIVAGGLATSAITGTAVITTDARLSDTRTPTDGTVTDAKIVSGGLATSAITGTAVITTDARLSDQRTPLDNSVTSAKIVDGTIVNADINAAAAVDLSKLESIGARSVVGNSSSGSGTPSAISAGSDGNVLRRSGTSLGFGEVATAGIADLAVTAAKIDNGTITNTQVSNTAAIDASKISGTAIVQSIVDAKGDLLAGTADNTIARVGVGTDGHVLTADSSVSAGVSWQVAAAPVDDPFPVGMFLGGM